MAIVNKKGCIYLFILVVFGYFLFPSLGLALSSSLIEDNSMGYSLLEDTDSFTYIAKAKKKKKAKKGKSKKKASKGSKVSKGSSSNSYWGISAGYLWAIPSNMGVIYADVRKDIFSNIFLYVQGKYTLGCSQYLTLLGGGLGALYSYRMSDLIEIDGGASFSATMFKLKEDAASNYDVFVNSSTDTTSMLLMYIDPRVGVALHLTPMVAVTVELGASINIVAGEEVVDNVKEFTGTRFHAGAGAMLTL